MLIKMAYKPVETQLVMNTNWRTVQALVAQVRYSTHLIALHYIRPIHDTLFQYTQTGIVTGHLPNLALTYPLSPNYVPASVAIRAVE